MITENQVIQAIVLVGAAALLLWPMARARAQSVPRIEATDLSQRMATREPLLLVDVREPGELVQDGMIAGAINIPMARVAGLPPELTEPLAARPETGVIVICRSGARASRVAPVLIKAGVTKLAVLDGGMIAWKRAGLPVAARP